MDFIYALPVGTQVDLVKRILGKFSSCMGISECLAAYCKDVAPNANHTDIAPVDVAVLVFLLLCLVFGR